MTIFERVKAFEQITLGYCVHCGDRLLDDDYKCDCQNDE